MERIKVGEKFPDFTVNTQLEKGTSISKLADGKPLMLMVIRYIGCRICRYDVHRLRANYNKFIEKGINVAMVMQSSVENVLEDLEKSDMTLPYPIVCDEGQAIYQTLRIDPAKTMDELLGEDRDSFKAKLDKAVELGIVHGKYEGIEEQLPAFFYLDSDLTVKVMLWFSVEL